MKAKKILLAILGLSMSLSAGLVLAACGDNSAEDHDLTLHKAIAATCTQAGNEEYYSCSDCGKLFADAEAKQEVTLDDVTIAALGHKPVEVAAKEATCSEDGWIAHYECENGCGTYFSDASGTTTIDAADVVTPKLNHKNIEEVFTDIDTDAGRGWLYHWHCPDCGKYFADSFGDEELSEEEVFFEKIDSVTVTLTGKKAGVSAPITQGSAALSGVGYEVTASGTVDTTLTLTDVYPVSYTIECGDYVGTIAFEAGKTAYEAELLYESFTAEGGAASAVDLSHMADEDAYITIANQTSESALAKFTDAGIETLGTAYYLQTNVRIDGASFSAWSDTIYFALSDGGDGDGDMGVALWMSVATDNIHICRYLESHVNDSGNPERAYDGKGNDVTSAAMCSAITSAIYSEAGLNVRVVRMGSVMALFYMDAAGDWVRFYAFETCAGDAQLMLGTSGTPAGASVVFSGIAFGGLTYHELQVPAEGQPGYLEHYTDSEGNFYDMDGNPVDAAEIQISVVPSVEDSIDTDLADEDAAYWLNAIYWEYYQQEMYVTTGSVTSMPEAADLIGFDVSAQTLTASEGQNYQTNPISLNGESATQLLIDGNVGAYNDITITVGKNAERIAVWVGAWLAKVRVSLYEGEQIFGVTEFTTNWNAVSKFITFDLDTSGLSDNATKTYTLKIEYLQSEASAGDARVRLSGIAVLGADRELTYHESGMVDGVLYKAHYTDKDGTYYTEDKVRTTKDALVIRYTMEDSVDTDLTDENSVHWMNPVYWEYYQQDGTTVTTSQKQNATDLIAFDAAKQNVVADQYENDKGISLDGSKKSHMIIDGNIVKFNDITITVGSAAKHIAVWTGAWLAKVRVSLYDGDTLVGQAEFEAHWNDGGKTSLNKLIIFDIDTSELEGEATKAYTLKVEYVSSCANAGAARVRLAGIAVLGEMKELTYHEESEAEGVITLAHYTDSEGKYYTTGKVLTTADALKLTYHAEAIADGNLVIAHYTDGSGNYYLTDRTKVTLDDLTYRLYTSENTTMEDSADTDLSASDALYWEYYQQTGTDVTTFAKDEADDLIALGEQTVVEDQYENDKGISLDGSKKSHMIIDGNTAKFSDITITVGKGAESIVVWTGAWLAQVKVSLYDGDTLVGQAEFEANWANNSLKASQNKRIAFAIDTSSLEEGATKTYTLKIEYVDGCAGAGNARVRLAGIAVYGEQAQAPDADEALPAEKE